MRNRNLGIFTFIIYLSYSAVSVAGVSQSYEDLEAGKCSDVVVIRNDERMIANAIIHAKAWCKGSGGVRRGAIENDYIAKTEGTGPYFCRVTGTIECNNGQTETGCRVERGTPSICGGIKVEVSPDRGHPLTKGPKGGCYFYVYGKNGHKRINIQMTATNLT
jgi:hypothetical protein